MIGRRAADDVDLRSLERQLEPIDGRSHYSHKWLLMPAAMLAVITLVLSFRHIKPFLFDKLPELAANWPIEAQILTPFTLLVLFIVGTYMVAKPMVRKVTETAQRESYLESLRPNDKVMVYAYGTGAIGFTTQLRKLWSKIQLPNLAVFAQPAKDGRSGIDISGPVIATSVIQHGRGRFENALASRDIETHCGEAHRDYLKAIGADRTLVELNLLHIGGGNTSISCHTKWNEERSTSIVDASPKRFGVIIKNHGSIESDKITNPIQEV